MKAIYIQVIQMVLYLAMVGLAGFATRFLHKKTVSEGINKVKSEAYLFQTELGLKQSFAELAVKYVEQKFKDLAGPDKFMKAAEFIATSCQAKGIELTPPEIEGLIEAAVGDLEKVFAADMVEVAPVEIVPVVPVQAVPVEVAPAVPV
jgi:hypothetical protein